MDRARGEKEGEARPHPWEEGFAGVAPARSAAGRDAAAGATGLLLAAGFEVPVLTEGHGLCSTAAGWIAFPCRHLSVESVDGSCPDDSTRPRSLLFASPLQSPVRGPFRAASSKLSALSAPVQSVPA